MWYVGAHVHAAALPRLPPTVASLSQTCHASELPVVFGNTASFAFTPQEADMSNAAQSYWSSFAKAGDPNAGSDPTASSTKWPLFNSDSRPTLLLATPLGVEGGSDYDICSFWDGMGYDY